MGCDAFALDITKPQEAWTKSTLQYLFEYAATTSFRLFFSLDTFACPDIRQNDALIKQYFPQKAYYKVDGKPFLSTFRGGNIDWTDFLASHGNPYFVPNFDDRTEYSSDPTEFLYGVRDVVNGTLSWETAWPPGGSTTPLSSLLDSSIISASHDLDKTYIAPLSALQFKDMKPYGFYYRRGGVSLARRMEQILEMPEQPDYVELISWNDAGESHYLGQIHPESMPPYYASASQWDHTAWQPLVTSFIRAYKVGAKSAAAMKPATPGVPTGSMWYRTVLSTASCQKPKDGETEIDSVNFAVVLPVGAEGYTTRIRSGGKVIDSRPAKPGLNYASVRGIRSGKQVLELVDSDGKACMIADGGLEVSGEAEGRCNYNFQVAGLQAPSALKMPRPIR